MAAVELPIHLFENVSTWSEWLKNNHALSPGLWMHFSKKGSGVQTVTYAEALDIALRYGWIDAQVKSADAKTYLQKFMPRARRSLWSKINREKALALIAAGWMQPAGLKAVEEAKANGRWDAAYDSSSKAEVPPDLQAALDRNAVARSFFATLSSANRYAILWRIQTVKLASTRAAKIEHFIAMLERGETVHPVKGRPTAAQDEVRGRVQARATAKRSIAPN